MVKYNSKNNILCYEKKIKSENKTNISSLIFYPWAWLNEMLNFQYFNISGVFLNYLCETNVKTNKQTHTPKKSPTKPN